MLLPPPRLDARPPRPRLPLPKPKKWRPLPHPLGIEATYTEALQGLVDKAFAVITRAMKPVLEAAEKEEREDALRLDAPKKKRPASFTFEVVVEDLPEKVERAMDPRELLPTIERTAKQTDIQHLRAVRKQFAEAVGVQVLREEPELRPVVRDFTKRNVALIKSLSKDILPQLRKEMEAALESGARPEAISKMLRERHGVAKRKAELIARDQVGKLYSSLTEERHKALGITRYRWRTSRDNRVRKRHVKREGVVFEYAKPPREDPTDGHPGTPIRCRCTAEPIIDDVLDPKDAVRVENTTEDPAPPEAPRPPRSRVPVEKLSEVVKQVAQVAKKLAKEKRATQAPGRRESPAPPGEESRAEKQPKKKSLPSKKEAAQSKKKEAVKLTPTAKKAASKVKSASEVVPVDRAKGWRDSRVYRVPVEELADVPAMAWNGREKGIESLYNAGIWDKLDPIKVMSDRETGFRELADGNHRLSFARAKGLKYINVRFSDRDAASIRARPPNPILPWFIRDNPERFRALLERDERFKHLFDAPK